MKGLTIHSLAAVLGASVLLTASSWLSEGCTPKQVEMIEMEFADTGPGGAIVIMPSTANVLTCDSVPLVGLGQTISADWNLQGPGTLTSSGVLPLSDTADVIYTAPNVTPNPAMVTVSDGEGKSTLTLATAFLGTADSLPIAGNGSVGQAFYPLAHTFAASGSQVYAGIGGPLVMVAGASLVNTMEVYSSSNSGAMFTKTVSFHTGNLFCGAIAIDAGDPSLVYLVYAAGHGDSTTNTGETIRLAVSTNGGTTFPVEYLLADTGPGNPSWEGCPDVVSPSAHHVIVSNVFDPSEQYWVATFVSTNVGIGIGESLSADPDGGVAYVAPSDTNSSRKSANAINSNAQLSPQLFTNGKGDACVVYIEAASTNVNVQCSTTNGMTWGLPATVARSSAMNSVATGAMSAGGYIAIAYQQPNSGGNDTFVTISKDGHSWDPPVKYPLPSWAAAGLAVASPEAFLAWESDSVLWLSETVTPTSDLTGVALLVDKTCDLGQTWSGAVNAGNYAAGGLVQTSAGMVAGGFVQSNAPMGPLLTLVPLAPPAP